MYDFDDRLAKQLKPSYATRVLDGIVATVVGAFAFIFGAAWVAIAFIIGLWPLWVICLLGYIALNI